MAKKDKGLLTGDPITYQTPSPAGGVQMETFIPWTLVKRGVKRQVITPIDAPEQFQMEATVERQERKVAQDTPLIRALGLAHHWQRLLDDGKVQTIADIAQMEGIDVTQVRRLLRLVLLAPTLVEMIVVSNEQASINLEFVLRRAMPVNWQEQGALFAQRH
ncbi:MAG: hypothetical protein Q8R67_05725 [Rhodoferax sp.]|nr:hypothetical protein [Rhodoferax sp.]MDP3651168.1 hypothetical protein [Rhodoferax sp.]